MVCRGEGRTKSALALTKEPRPSDIRPLDVRLPNKVNLLAVQPIVDCSDRVASVCRRDDGDVAVSDDMFSLSKKHQCGCAQLGVGCLPFPP